MRNLKTVLVAKLVKVGVAATAIEFYPGEDGGFVVRVGKLADTFPAEEVAEEVTRDFGVTVLVAF